MKTHFIWMILGCGLPILLLFFLPAFGVDNEVSVFGFLILMFGCHLIHLGMHQNGTTHPHNGKSD